MRIFVGILQALLFGPGARYRALGRYDGLRQRGLDPALSWSKAYKAGYYAGLDRAPPYLPFGRVFRKPWTSPLVVVAVAAGVVVFLVSKIEG